MLLTDRGYDTDWIRELADGRVGQHPAGSRSQQRSALLRPFARNRVKRFFNKFTQCRPAATRYDRLVATLPCLRSTRVNQAIGCAFMSPRPSLTASLKD
ncbi:transposase (plasmid) [Bradyrhizobium sp. 155]|nr:transposase [Bradyrhizobium sp. 156]UPK16040.1 transposase [Bradyrhizobium sp. 155]